MNNGNQEAIEFVLGEMRDVDVKMQRVRHTLAHGTNWEKVRAAGEQAELELAAAHFRATLAQLTRVRSRSAFRIGLETEIRQLVDALERWVDTPELPA